MGLPRVDWEVDVSEDQTVVSVFGQVVAPQERCDGTHFRLTVSSNAGHDAAASMAEIISIMMSLEITRRLMHAFGVIE